MRVLLIQFEFVLLCDDLCHLYMQFINESRQTSVSPKGFQSTLQWN